MTSYNHAAFVGEQICSIMAQTYRKWHLTVSDDGSTDGSLDIIKRCQAQMPDHITLVHGPGRGFPYNHFWLAANADPDAAYYIWADSDDVWLPNRLERLVEMMAPYGQSEPVLYGNRVAVIDEAGRERGFYQLLDRRPPCFGNALVQVITAGPTVAFNRPARELIAIDLKGKLPASQDWWAYLMVSGAGGRVIYDPCPTVRYRCHGGNILGSNKGIKAKIARFQSVINGGFRSRIERNLAALVEHSGRLTPENRERLKAMDVLHFEADGPLRRLTLARKAGLYRQSFTQTMIFYAMAAFGRL